MVDTITTTDTIGTITSSRQVALLLCCFELLDVAEPLGDVLEIKYRQRVFMLYKPFHRRTVSLPVSDKSRANLLARPVTLHDASPLRLEDSVVSLLAHLPIIVVVQLLRRPFGPLCESYLEGIHPAAVD